MNAREAAEDLDADAPRAPTRRDDRIMAMPGEKIPAEVSEAFLADLATERALSTARKLVIGAIGPTEPLAGGLQAVRGRIDPSELAAGLDGLPAAI
jgi:hypothetical protein